MPLDETSYLVLIHLPSNYLLYKVSDNMCGRREAPGRKLINLIN
jgi:hypothetical protein